MVKLSIIIVNWNTTDYLIKCLKSVFENPPDVSFEIIVVDNNSDDDVCRLKEIFPEIRLIKNAYNYGFGVGNNIGFRFSSGEYVMTLNPDTVLAPGTINKLISALEKDNEVGIAVPVLKNQKVARSQYTFFNLFFNSVFLRKFRDFFAAVKRAETAPFDVKFLSGTGYVCRRSALEKGCIFSEENFLFGEEYYLCRQVVSKGYKIRVVTAARFEHYTSVTFKNDTERLLMATKLGLAVGWRIRREHWGNLLGIISSTLLCLETAVKGAVLVLSQPFIRKNDAQRSRVLSQCKSIVRAYLPILLDENKYLTEINEQSKLFFNSGRKPESPPVFTEVINEFPPGKI